MHNKREIPEYPFATGTEVQVPRTQLLVHGTAWSRDDFVSPYGFLPNACGRTTSKSLILRNQHGSAEAPVEHEVNCLEGRWF